MLAYCRTHRSKVRYVVVQDLSRFARNNQDQAQTISELGRIGVLLRSTYESNIDETAAGRLAANIFGTFNQYFPMRCLRKCAIVHVSPLARGASLASAHRLSECRGQGWPEYQT
jgi:hypothetical protein